MCGLLFVKTQDTLISFSKVKKALSLQEWRGPDAQILRQLRENIFMGHVRLYIIDPSERSNQPLFSEKDRYAIVYNGEIYNHNHLRKKYNLTCETGSDTETILQGFILIGHRIFEELDGMFSIIIHDNHTNKTWVARDRYGIKPLYVFRSNSTVIYSSETISINHLIASDIDLDSIKEWRLIRRPAIGMTFFKKINEVPPGAIMCDDETVGSMVKFEALKQEFSQQRLEELLTSSIKKHELSDVANVGLLSGGIDSSIICAISGCAELYTVGTEDNNEFQAANETASKIKRNLNQISVTAAELQQTWKKLIKLKGEPILLPNEALIYQVCNGMQDSEKVVLTGEGADEIFFGYDRIFRYCNEIKILDVDKFLDNYGYASVENCTERLRQQLDQLKCGKTPLEFCEDFFYQFHLTTLLRRMDFASMAASKEARVPFVTQSLIEYMYRVKFDKKLNEQFSKLPLREMISRLGLQNVLSRQKIGFSATMKGDNRLSEYAKFQDFNLEVLGW
jgi:asparagine synthase (glutamine-hydrolysing)